MIESNIIKHTSWRRFAWDFGGVKKQKKKVHKHEMK